MGMQQQADQWLWSCTCGAAGELTSREEAREDFKKHRRTCGMGSQPEGQSIMSTTAKKNVVAKAQKAAPQGTPGAALPNVRKRKDQSVSKEGAKAAYDRLKKGETTLITESKQLGFTHNGPLRKALRDLVGNDKYDALMEGSRPKGAKKAEAKAPAKKAAVKAPAAAKKPAAQKPAAVDAAADEKPAVVDEVAA